MPQDTRQEEQEAFEGKNRHDPLVVVLMYIAAVDASFVFKQRRSNANRNCFFIGVIEEISVQKHAFYPALCFHERFVASNIHQALNWISMWREKAVNLVTQLKFFLPEVLL